MKLLQLTILAAISCLYLSSCSTSKQVHNEGTVLASEELPNNTSRYEGELIFLGVTPQLSQDSTAGGTSAKRSTFDDEYGRAIIYKNTKGMLEALGHDINGDVMIWFCVDKSGTVNYSEIVGPETTITEREALKKVLSVFWDYKVEPDPSAPENQCGKYRFRYTSN